MVSLGAIVGGISAVTSFFGNRSAAKKQAAAAARQAKLYKELSEKEAAFEDEAGRDRDFFLQRQGFLVERSRRQTRLQLYLQEKRKLGIDLAKAAGSGFNVRSADTISLVTETANLYFLSRFQSNLKHISQNMSIYLERIMNKKNTIRNVQRIRDEGEAGFQTRTSQAAAIRSQGQSQMIYDAATFPGSIYQIGKSFGR